MNTPQPLKRSLREASNGIATQHLKRFLHALDNAAKERAREDGG